MSTEIHRLPGSFTLPNDWPRARVGNLASGLWAEYVGDDLTAASGTITTGHSGVPAALPWTSRTAVGTLVSRGAAGAVPNVAHYTDRFGGHRYASFTGGMGAESALLAEAYTGPLTVSGYFFVGEDGRTFNTLFSTGTTTTGTAVVRRSGTTDMLSMAVTPSAGGTATALEVACPINLYAPFVACFNGAESYLSFNGTTVTGTLPTPPVHLFRVGSNAAGDQGYYGRISHMRVHRRALTTDEAWLSDLELRALYG